MASAMAVRTSENRISSLQAEKKRLMWHNHRIYCSECRKYYPEGKCKIRINFGEGGWWFDDIEAKCPKGHSFIVHD
ncbi:MAG: hypothetical protein HYW26_01435 [Candidatus Aenigmarchaeota archaeon]|nr:hypothetical protein [Candidatus Aenigmarchaeota archaeon]